MAKNILVLCPTYKDIKSLAGRNFLFYGEDIIDLHHFNPSTFLEKARCDLKQLPLEGILAIDDYPASIVGAIIARERGLPFAQLETILLCQHKYYSRLAQREIVPEATPLFALATEKPPLPFPFFVKPVKSYFSINATKVTNEIDYQNALAVDHNSFVAPFNYFLSQYSAFSINADHFLAEELLEGQQVTVEGFVSHGKTTIMGVVDSFFYPNTFSFERFVYPSKLDKQVQQRMAKIAERFMGGIGFDQSCFNIEMMYNAVNDTIYIVEINPRMSSQFADLFEKVDGTNTYDLQIALSRGMQPLFQQKKGKYKIAASFVLRTFEDKKIARLPKVSELAQYEDLFDARISLFGKKGGLLSEELQDGKSYRYGLINLGAQSKEELFVKYHECRQALSIDFEKG